MAGIFNNTQFNDGWGRVADNAPFYTPVQRQAGEQQKPLVDGWGRLITLTTPFDENGLYVPAQASSGDTLRDYSLICPNICKLVALAGYNSNTDTDMFIQLYNTSDPTPGAFDTVKIIIPVPKGKTTFSYSLPWIFTLGLWIGISTTELTYTLPPAPCLSFSVVYTTGIFG